MSKIINDGKSEEHIIKPYVFKEIKEKKPDNIQKIKEKKEENDNSPTQKVEENKIIEKLLVQIEELSKNITNIEKKFESQLAECKQRVDIEKDKAFESGYKKGLKEGTDKCKEEMKEKINLLEKSIEKIDKINETFEEKILSVEKELSSVALDIAKEVIQKEISKESSEIAYNLAKSLMENIKDASKIKLKVNPKDAEFLKGKFKNIDIIPDSAIKEGGVVIISDLGNIDAQVGERFNSIKKAVLENKE